MFDHDALGPPGRTGGEDHERRVGGQAGDRQRPVGLVERTELGQHQDRVHVLDQRGQALRRVARVERQVGGARLQHADQRQDEVQRAGQSHGDEALRGRPAPDQLAGQPVRPGVQLPVGELARPVHDRDGLGRARGLLGEQVHHRRVGHRVGGGVPVHQQLVALLRGQDLQRGQRLVRVGHGTAQDAQQLVHDPGRGGLVEQVGGVLQVPAQPRRRVVPQPQVQVELGGAGEQFLGVEGGSALGHVVQREHDLEQRVVRGRARGVECPHHAVEGHVLVGERGEVGVPGPPQQLAEGRVPLAVHAQHQRVGEEADQPVQRGVGAPGESGTDRDVAARAQPGQQGDQRRLHHHEHRAVRGPRQRGQIPVQQRVQLHWHRAAPVAGDLRPCTVGGQHQAFRRIAQSRPPVRQLLTGQTARIGLVPEQIPLPQHVVRVLHGQRRPLRRPPHTARLVGQREVRREHPFRPAVGDDVVRQQQQRVLEQHGAEGRFTFQVEGLPCRLPHGALTCGHPSPRHDPLVRHTIGRGERRAQDLVPLHEVVDRGAQRGTIHLTAEPEQQRHAVPRGLGLVEEPQALLREGQRHLAGPRCGDRRGAGRTGSVQAPGQLGHRARLEHLAHGELGAELGAYPADEPRGQQGLPAQCEEVGVDADAGESEQVGDQAAELVLARCAGRAALGQSREVGCGQGRAVHLAVGQQRQLGQGHHGRGHHVLRQPLGHVLANRRRVGLGHHVTDQLLARPHHHCGPADGLVVQQRRLDLAEFHSEAADLHLLVRATDQLQRAVGATPREVAGAVHRAAAERVGHEALGGLRGLVQVAARQPGASQVQLAHLAFGHRAEPFVQQVRGGVVHRRAESLTSRGEQAVAAGLGAPVQVEQHGAGQVLGEPLGQRGGQRFPAADPQPARGKLLGAAHLQELRDQARHHGDAADPVLRDGLAQFHRAACGGGVGQHHQGSVQQRAEQLRGPVDEADRAAGQHRLLGVERVRLGHPGQPVDQSPVQSEHPLGPPGGPRGVDHVGRAERGERPDAVRVGRVGGRLVAGGTHLLGAQHARWRRVGQHELLAAHRVREVHGQVGGARLEHAEQRDDQVHRPRQHQGHHVLRADPARDEVVRDLVRARVELGRGQRARAAHQRPRPRFSRHAGLEHLGQGETPRAHNRHLLAPNVDQPQRRRVRTGDFFSLSPNPALLTSAGRRARSRRSPVAPGRGSPVNGRPASRFAGTSRGGHWAIRWGIPVVNTAEAAIPLGLSEQAGPGAFLGWP